MFNTITYDSYARFAFLFSLRIKKKGKISITIIFLVLIELSRFKQYIYISFFSFYLSEKKKQLLSLFTYQRITSILLVEKSVQGVNIYSYILVTLEKPCVRTIIIVLSFTRRYKKKTKVSLVFFSCGK